MDRAEIAIIGGGAAGLTSAIFAAQALQTATPRSATDSEEPRAPANVRVPVLVLDGAKILGAKILVSGGGRCNVTHRAVSAKDFNAAQPVVRNILAAFDVEAATRWFESLGVKLKLEETGKLFPATDSAKTVLRALLDRCARLGVTLATECRVTALEQSAALPDAPLGRSAQEFVITHAQGHTVAKRIIIATGGKSLPRSGSDGAAWALLEALGHTVTSTHAALVPLVLEPEMFHVELSGLSHEAELIVVFQGKIVDRRTGSLLWTHFGISGPVVMDASRHWTTVRDALPRDETLELRLNFLPGETTESADKWLIELATSRPRGALLRGLASRLYERVASALLHKLALDPALPLSQLSRVARRQLAQALTAFVLPVSQHRGWNYAEVTAGGVPLNEIDYRTMASRRVPGLYLAGEVLDCDGRIGGFNFQWAWATGYLAGNAAAKSV